MESEGSLRRSQEPSTGPYPKPHESSPYHLTLSTMNCNTCIIHHPGLGLFIGVFPSGFHTNILYPIFSCSPVKLHALTISFYLT
jgi:hypothetical protein